ncbi:hypothetical protein QOZ80_5BG0428720 [Eleusine coracana subsp. coracana]|nr:hypothetical protein QOZ80_5BG0428720 [Eleusine coracana subsp. coracana]
MEPAEVWVPCDLQLANWITEPVVYAPYLAVEYASTDIFDNCIQTSAPDSNGQIVEYAAAGPIGMIAEQEFVDESHNMDINDAERVFKGAVEDVAKDEEPKGMKMYKFPESIIRARGLRERCATVPMVMAIGPYHQHQANLKKAEKMKYAAACHCIAYYSTKSRQTWAVQEMYDAVVEAARGARKLYDQDVVAGISDDDFLPMMFYDACFLVQYMFVTYTNEICKDMRPFCNFIDSNEADIFHDIMLLENQLPWPVVDAVLKFMPEPTLRGFIKMKKGCLQDRKENVGCFRWNGTCDNPPHLLGLLQHYIVGRSKKPRPVPKGSISLSVGANELVEMGISLRANKTTEVIHMGIKPRWILLAELSLAPLSLDDVRASCVLNMEALELCRTPNFQGGGVRDEESAVCSYLLLLASLVNRAEDVQVLREKHILQGGAGLTNKEVLNFFTSFRGLRLGTCYVRTMVEIERYKSKWIVTKGHAFIYNHWKLIMTVSGVISSIVTFVVKFKC